MQAGEQTAINQSLANIDPKHQKCPEPHSSNIELYIDTFRHPYIKFDAPFALPGINTIEVRKEEAHEYVNVLREKIPFFIAGCSLLPESRPRKNSNQLQFVKAIQVDSYKFLYMIKISAEYFGGASPDEIVSDRQQEVSPGIMTDRIYYNARIIPVQNVTLQKNAIIDFEPYQLKEAIFSISSREMERDMWSTILFDEVDFTQINESLTEMFRFHGAEWKPGRLMQPFVIDYLTLNLNLFYPCVNQIASYTKRFASVFDSFLKKKNADRLSDADRTFWHNYYRSFLFERVLSRSGNPHWKFSGSLPDQ